MSNRKTDISQIRKYLNGELDARAMHQLERRAQDDPFLMDALEGYTGKKDQQPNLDELQHRLHQRIQQGKTRRMILWPVISVAATALLFVAAGGWFLLIYQPNHRAKAPVTEEKVVVKTPAPAADQKREKAFAPAQKAEPPVSHHQLATIIPPAATAADAQIVPEEGNAEIRIDEPVAKSDVKQVIEDSTKVKGKQLGEVKIIGYTAQRKQDITGAVATVTAPQLDTLLRGKAAGLDVTYAKRNGKVKLPADSVRVIKGKVIGKDGLPVVGATVRLANKTAGTVTDVNGNYQINATGKDVLQFAFVGYNTKTEKINNKDKLDVTLAPNANALSEVVVVGYGKAKDNEPQSAHPAEGWSAFKKYLKENAVSADGKAGKVRLKFTVNSDNTLTGITVLKSLSPENDQQAVKLIGNGPLWIHNSNGEAETVHVTIRFTAKP